MRFTLIAPGSRGDIQPYVALARGLQARGHHALGEHTVAPQVQASNVPLTPTAAFPGVLVPPLPGPRRVTYPLSHRLTRQVLWATMRAGANAARRDVIGLPGAPLVAPFSRGPLARGPVLYGISTHVIPRPADWRAPVEMTGFWFLDEPVDWAPPAAVGVGPAPIPRRRLAAAALAAAIRRAVDDPGMRRRASELGARVRSEDGVGCAVRAMERALQGAPTA